MTHDMQCIMDNRTPAFSEKGRSSRACNCRIFDLMAVTTKIQCVITGFEIIDHQPVTG